MTCVDDRLRTAACVVVDHQRGGLGIIKAATNVTVMVQLLPAASDAGQRFNVMNSSELPPCTMAISGSLIVIVALPTFFTVTVLVTIKPSQSPKLMLPGEMLAIGMGTQALAEVDPVASVVSPAGQAVSAVCPELATQ